MTTYYNNVTTFRRGDVLLVDFGEAFGSEQGGIRPAIVIQNDIGNIYAPTIIVCAITSRIKKEEPTHAALLHHDSGLVKDSIVLCEQIKTIDKRRVIKKYGHISHMSESMIKALTISLGLVYNNGNVLICS